MFERDLKSLVARVRKFESYANGLLFAAIVYVSISVYFLFGLIISRGDVAQEDWGPPLTANAAMNTAYSYLFVWKYIGLGPESALHWGFPFFGLVNAALAPLGFFGGTEVKILSVFLVALAGITAYVLSKSFGLGFSSSFLCGLFFMTTPVVFDWLMFGWIDYSFGYAFLPLMILAMKKFLDTSDLRYALINGLLLSFVMSEQPAFLLVYPLVGILFVLFEARGKLRIILNGLLCTVISLLIWFIASLTFFTSFNNSTTTTFYQDVYFPTIYIQFFNFGSFLNPIRLWGSTYNFQFETYFPSGMALLSFLPIVVGAIAVLFRPRDKWALFSLTMYLFVFAAYQNYASFAYLVHELPFGSIFEAPSVFLAPASLGLALLIGYANRSFSFASTKLRMSLKHPKIRFIVTLLVLIVVVLGGTPWWTGQATGVPAVGAASKLDLYQIPSDYRDWTNAVSTNSDYFVFYVPFAGDVRVANTSDFSGAFDGVSGVIFTLVNNLPYVSSSDTSSLLGELLNESSSVAIQWGSYSIKYIVVYTNIQSSYNISDVLNRLSSQSGIEEVENLTNVVVYQDQYAKPVVYANGSDVTTKIIYHDPTDYRIVASSLAPYLLVLDQAYSSGWTLSMNGTSLPAADHVKLSNGFNGWYINNTGTFAVSIYYEPQTVYEISLIVSAVVITCTSLYVVVTALRDRRSSKVRTHAIPASPP